MRSTFAFCLLVMVSASQLLAVDPSVPKSAASVKQAFSRQDARQVRSIAQSSQKLRSLGKQMLIVNPSVNTKARTSQAVQSVLRRPIDIARRQVPRTPSSDSVRKAATARLPQEYEIEPAFSRKPAPTLPASKDALKQVGRAKVPSKELAKQPAVKKDTVPSVVKSPLPPPPKTELPYRRINVAPADATRTPSLSPVSDPVGSAVRRTPDEGRVPPAPRSVFVADPIMDGQSMEALLESGTHPKGSPDSLVTRLTIVPADATNSVAEPATHTDQKIQFESDVPQLRVSTVGPNTLVVGKSGRYGITLINKSNFDAYDVQVRCSIPGWVDLDDHEASTGEVVNQLRDVVWLVKHVPARGEQTLNLDLTPTAGRAFELNVDISVQPSQTRKRIAIQEPKLALNLVGPESVVYGEFESWQIEVTNPGTGDANDVVLEVYSGSRKLESKALGSIAAGSSRNATLEIQAKEIGRHGLRLVATGNPLLRDELTDEFLCRRGRLSVSIAGSDLEYAGTATRYEVALQNDGDAATQNVLMNLELPSGVQYVSGLESPTVTAGGVSWVVSKVAVDQRLMFPIVLQLRDGGSHVMAVNASSTGDLEAAAKITTAAMTSADLKLKVSDPIGPQPSGETMSYEIEVFNQGSKAARQIEVIAVCAPELVPQDVDGNAHIKGGHIYFKPIAELPADHKVSFVVRTLATEAGAHAFRVIVKSYEPNQRLAIEESTQFYERKRVEPVVEVEESVLENEAVEETARRIQPLQRSRLTVPPPFSTKPEPATPRKSNRVVKPELIDLEVEEMAARSGSETR